MMMKVDSEKISQGWDRAFWKHPLCTRHRARLWACFFLLFPTTQEVDDTEAPSQSVLGCGRPHFPAVDPRHTNLSQPWCPRWKGGMTAPIFWRSSRDKDWREGTLLAWGWYLGLAGAQQRGQGCLGRAHLGPALKLSIVSWCIESSSTLLKTNVSCSAEPGVLGRVWESPGAEVRLACGCPVQVTGLILHICKWHAGPSDCYSSFPPSKEPCVPKRIHL